MLIFLIWENSFSYYMYDNWGVIKIKFWRSSLFSWAIVLQQG
jgi:hypothetical protein